MPKGSPRPNAGRPKGARNAKTAEAVKATEDTGITPLEYLLAEMRDPLKDDATRRDCAKAAAPYVHARLTTVEAKVEGDMNHVYSWLAS